MAPPNTQSYLDDGHVGRGIALICGAFLLFACLDTSAKVLSRDLDTLQIAWARFVGHAVLVTVVLMPRKGPRVFATSNLRLQLARSVLLVMSTVLNFTAVSYLPLTTTASIFFTAPLLVAALSVPMLGENVGWRRWSAIGVGFIGVLVIIRPGAAEVHWAIGLCLANALVAALYSIATRKLAARDHSDTTSIYSPLVGAVILLPALPYIWSPPETAMHWVLLCLTGVFGGVGHWLVIIAHRYAGASVLAPFTYSAIVWMTISGYLVFGDLPDEWTIAGAVIVVASGLYVFHREQIRKAER
ncbi:MAG: DMT family transporter [Thalassobaculaceae bacterium]|nr:DMT family transporter [Thalassobaculaceae bacterium]